MNGIIGTTLVALGTVSVAANAAAPGDALYPVKETVRAELNDMIVLDTTKQAEAKAERFAQKLEMIAKLGSSRLYEPEASVVLRNEVRESFEDAYAAIEELEESGELADAAVARAIIQTAIEYHMEQAFTVSPELSTDLSVYSAIMTESLIAKAVAA